MDYPEDDETFNLEMCSKKSKMDLATLCHLAAQLQTSSELAVIHFYHIGEAYSGRPTQRYWYVQQGRWFQSNGSQVVFVNKCLKCLFKREKPDYVDFYFPKGDPRATYVSKHTQEPLDTTNAFDVVRVRVQTVSKL